MFLRQWMESMKSTSSGGSTGSTGSWGSPTTVTISSGAVTVTGPGWYKIDTEGGAASDDLDTINGLSAGEEIVLTLADAAHAVVLKDGTGNLDLGGDITLNSLTDQVRLFHNGTNLIEAASRP